ncbi:MAG: c-type cytochrome [Gammaproteobacteria bacterium]
MNNRYRSIFFLVLFSGLAGLALAEDQDKSELLQAIALKGDPVAGEAVYGLCASCHEASGWGEKDGSVPVIAGQHPKVILKQLADIRSRNRENPVMYPFTDPETIGGAQSIADVTAYIATLPRNPQPSVGDGKQLAVGEEIYRQQCVACHGEYGEGNNDAFFPHIQGQHYGYLYRQLIWFRNGLRKNANPVMLEKVRDMMDNEISAVADYVSRLRTPGS